MKDLSNYVVYQDGKFWIDTEDPDTGEVPFVVGERFTFESNGVDCEGGVGVVECDDGVNEFAMIPFRVI